MLEGSKGRREEGDGRRRGEGETGRRVEMAGWQGAGGMMEKQVKSG
jgi:hypothetical protein